MINYLKNAEIDREQWDNCIKHSAGPVPYAYSWYLDIMAPGWEALTDDGYGSVFPLPCSTKYGIHYIATPNFLQQLGIYSPDGSQEGKANEFIDYIPDFYWLVDLCIGQRISSDDFRMTPRANYELDLSRPYEELRKSFSAHCIRNIDKGSKEKYELVEDIEPEELISLFRQNRGIHLRGIRQRDYDRLGNLMKYCVSNRKGRILGVREAGKRLIYGIFLVEVKGRKTMLFVVNTPGSREKRTGYYVVDELIRESAGTKTILDFAGSSIPSVASFMESFGSKAVPFYRIFRNTLPWPLRIFKS
ncbi:MAG: hypothetical protein MUE74_02800 [Bacteroidales bacterium]|nr:hypothetical protein [Bacteroidales bacterium]